MKKAELLQIMDEKIREEKQNVENTLNFFRKRDGHLKVEGNRILSFRARTISIMETMRDLAASLDE